ncbi:MAG: dTDP-4-amino-4,6-dideoxygalactose transaminase [Deltaproteobacteria bacterium]|nr:dTDP-4-amino-4,6-dideoxygalactose transaminase [Candidatus Tharpella sp.]
MIESDPIPFNRPFIVGKELYYISQAVMGGHLSGDGPFTKRCQEWMEKSFAARKVLLTHSCTAALEMAALLCDIKPRDEVIMPSYTFVSTANAFVLRGARIRFVDIREDTLNLDENLLEQVFAEASPGVIKAVVPVHYAGVACEMEQIKEFATAHHLMVIEDAAQGVDATYKGAALGTLGDLGAYSFHETKNFISGEGGALLINNPELISRAEIIREKGTDRSQFFRGEIDKYSWIDLGSSYLPSELVAAFLYAQLEAAARITATRRAIYDFYAEALRPLAERGLISLPVTPADCTHNAHMFYLIVKGAEDERDRLLAFLKKRAIHAVFHYIPLHLSPMGRKLGYQEGDLPRTEALSGRVLRLPCYFELTLSQRQRVVAAVFDFFKS